jgi:hypothetical protein
MVMTVIGNNEGGWVGGLSDSRLRTDHDTIIAARDDRDDGGRSDNLKHAPLMNSIKELRIGFLPFYPIYHGRTRRFMLVRISNYLLPHVKSINISFS